MTDTFRSVEWRDGIVRLLDQRVLPLHTTYIDYTDHRELALAITDMVVRGAPAIGATAGYGMALAAQQADATESAAFRAQLAQAAATLRAARPTAVNLGWAIDRVMARLDDPALRSVEQLRAAIFAEAHAIADQDGLANRQLGVNALPLVPEHARFIHHCNTGSLATMEYGTALGVIRAAFEQGKVDHVYVDETRPRFQGARLTAWELQQLGVPHTVILDSASGHVMRTRGVDLCVVGCDRVALNGDTANKIGTYNLAIAARAHGVPFYVAAPTSTIDLSLLTGDEIEIEERAEREVTHVGDEQITPDGVAVFNPSFDVTPAAYITAIITEMGVAYPPFNESLPLLVKQANEQRQAPHVPAHAEEGA